MQRRGFLAAILGGVGALLAGKLPARAQEPELVEIEPDHSDAWHPGGFAIIDDNNPITKDGRIIHLSGMGTEDIPEGRYWGEKGEDIVSAFAQQIDVEIMGECP